MFMTVNQRVAGSSRLGLLIGLKLGVQIDSN